ncbi:flagellar basal body-associated FliL family protein [Marinobacter fonticola]|uniref:flagellar basal body-associated FliL family protein n=1 Tax=Marinobacter fonticola TaxID=2603215 RepID=UPI00143CF7F7|nr:flagellar basal body-associated FliL family protein [Marinobacter fonticola]
MMLRRLVFATSLVLAGLSHHTLHAEEEDTDEAAEEQAEATPSIYVEMKPAFVTNIGQSGGRLSYVKAEVTLRVTSADAETAVTNHAPRLRHEMVMLLGNQNREELSTPQGQESLRTQALEQFNQVLEQEQTGTTIQDVLFTSFVVQR